MSSIDTVAYKCAANHCHNKYYRSIDNSIYKNKRFFRFPEKDSKRRQHWFQLMNLSSTESRLYLCEEHFKEVQFCNSMKTRLTKFALPFYNKDIPKINIISNILIKSSTKSENVPDIITFDSPTSNSPLKRKQEENSLLNPSPKKKLKPLATINETRSINLTPRKKNSTY